MLRLHQPLAQHRAPLDTEFIALSIGQPMRPQEPCQRRFLERKPR
jgi:hypothetical protein